MSTPKPIASKPLAPNLIADLLKKVERDPVVKAALLAAIDQWKARAQDAKKTP
ncbi:hypothetical protein GWK36_00725 [Caldichromatium japonicum]|uniref:Uncharacterized protein n=1 Tax=Caldichromatium japonicum TaxID=2699430 RepID=A0A6G7VA66_9GAMM|nr:hypothetical protein [Caldichromatium japonicum]QIK36765.1 hypothetical protein GWK36_00725 [Caldichromatium japonicum]